MMVRLQQLVTERRTDCFRVGKRNSSQDIIKCPSCSKQCVGKQWDHRTDKNQLFLSQTEVRDTECSCNAL